MTNCIHLVYWCGTGMVLVRYWHFCSSPTSSSLAGSTCAGYSPARAGSVVQLCPLLWEPGLDSGMLVTRAEWNRDNTVALRVDSRLVAVSETASGSYLHQVWCLPLSQGGSVVHTRSPAVSNHEMGRNRSQRKWTDLFAVLVIRLLAVQASQVQRRM